MIVPKDKSKTKRQEKRIEKKCDFTGCNVIELMTARGKFCKEHKKPKYRKIIDQNKNRKKDLSFNSNIQIKHKYDEVTVVKRPCNTCGDDYEIKLFPKIYIYSGNCAEHQNPYKRNLYMNKKVI